MTILPQLYLFLLLSPSSLTQTPATDTSISTSASPRSAPLPPLSAPSATSVDLPTPNGVPHMDLLDWLALFFGFQYENVRNQREHIVLHLANAQMRLNPPPENIDTLDVVVLRKFRKKLLLNYTNWCSYRSCKSNIWISDTKNRCDADQRRELLYASLYLLIWGEAANLRFVPECLCYIFHNMAMELNKILEDYIDESTGQPVMPSVSGENAFLNCVVKPIYDTIRIIRAEVEGSKNGTYSGVAASASLSSQTQEKDCCRKRGKTESWCGSGAVRN